MAFPKAAQALDSFNLCWKFVLQPGPFKCFISVSYRLSHTSPGALGSALPRRSAPEVEMQSLMQLGFGPLIAFRIGTSWLSSL